MLVIPRVRGQGLWIGPIFLRVKRIRVGEPHRERIVEFGVEAPPQFSIVRDEHMQAKCDHDLRVLGYERLAEGLIVPGDLTLRAA